MYRFIMPIVYIHIFISVSNFGGRMIGAVDLGRYSS